MDGNTSSVVRVNAEGDAVIDYVDVPSAYDFFNISDGDNYTGKGNFGAAPTILWNFVNATFASKYSSDDDDAAGANYDASQRRDDYANVDGDSHGNSSIVDRLGVNSSSSSSSAEDLLVVVVVNATEFYDKSTTTTTSIIVDEIALSTTGPSDEQQSTINSSLDEFDYNNYNWYFLALLVFVAAGMIGNTLVCLAICLERRLQNVTNYFLMSLAVADLLVSAVVMPFGIIVGFIGHWPFSDIMCNVYVTCDVLACSSSIMHMCFISIGRYMGIRNPLKTRHNSKKMVGVKIVLVWLLSMVISSPITILGTIDAANIRPHSDVCAIDNRFFFIFGSLFAFYVPMVIMVVSYVLTVQLLRQQKKFGDDLPASRRVQLSRRRRIHHRHHHHYHHHYHYRNRGENRQQLEQLEPQCHLDNDRRQRQQQQQQQTLANSGVRFRSIGGGEEHSASSSAATLSNNGHLNSYRTPRHLSKVSTCERSTQTTSDPSLPQTPTTTTTTTTSGDSQRLTRLRSLRLNLPKSPSTFHLRFLAIRKRSRSSSMVGNSVANEQKASKVLGIVFSTFVVCWAPFFVLNIVFAVCPSYQVSDDIVDTCLWLGYVSSTINPIIYTIFNRTFKEAFIKLLLCRCWVLQRNRYSSSRIYRYVDALAQTPSVTENLCLRSPTTPSSDTCDGHESIC